MDIFVIFSVFSQRHIESFDCSFTNISFFSLQFYFLSTSTILLALKAAAAAAAFGFGVNGFGGCLLSHTFYTKNESEKHFQTEFFLDNCQINWLVEAKSLHYLQLQQ